MPKKPRTCLCGCGTPISPYRSWQRYSEPSHRTKHYNNVRSKEARRRKKRIIEGAFLTLAQDQIRRNNERKEEENKLQNEKQEVEENEVLKKSRGG